MTRAVGLMATHANPIQATNSIAFTIDTIGEAFGFAAFTLIGAGMLALAAAAQHHRHSGWASYTIVTALLLLTTAAGYTAGHDNFLDLMLTAGGGVLLPVWLIWTRRIGRTRHSSPGTA